MTTPAARMAAADALVDVRIRVRRGSLDVVDELAASRGVSRAEVVREAITWLVVREARQSVRKERRDLVRHHRGELEALRRKVAAVERSLTSSADLSAGKATPPSTSGERRAEDPESA